MDRHHPGSVDLRAEVRKIRAAALVSLGFCAVCFAAGYVLLLRFFEFPEGIVDRMVFVLRADVFILLWVLIGVGLVSRGRRRSAVDISGALSGHPSARIAVEAAFLQNTLEQAVLAVGAHLALATLLQGDALALVVVAVFLFGLGRAAFLHGYRKGAGGRAFGMVTTALPTLAGYGLAAVLIALRLWKT